VGEHVLSPQVMLYVYIANGDSIVRTIFPQTDIRISLGDRFLISPLNCDIPEGTRLLPSYYSWGKSSSPFHRRSCGA